jgi:hypothetical protein
MNKLRIGYGAQSWRSNFTKDTKLTQYVWVIHVMNVQMKWDTMVEVENSRCVHNQIWHFIYIHVRDKKKWDPWERY